jgi:acyl dehydratase
MTEKLLIQWEVGDELASQTLEPTSRLQLIKYAGASGDFNPIHTIDEAASNAGLPGVIQHGMLTMATIGRLLSPYLDAGFIKEFHARFTGMVFVGDVITIGGKVTAKEENEQGTLYSFDVFARNQKEQNVALGQAAFLVLNK